MGLEFTFKQFAFDTETIQDNELNYAVFVWIFFDFKSTTAT